MNSHRITDPCQTAWDWIERAVDGTLGALEAKRLDEHLRTCSACAALYDDAVTVRGLVHAAPRPVCPARTVEAVLARIDGAADARASRRRWAIWHWAAPSVDTAGQRIPRPLPRPGWARVGMALAAAAVLLVLLVPTVLRHGQPPAGSVAHVQPQPLTDEQRAQAQVAVAQARLALGVLARTLDRTSAIAEQNVRASIAAPLQRALEPRGRRADEPHDRQQDRDRRTGALPGAVWMTGKC